MFKLFTLCLTAFLTISVLEKTENDSHFHQVLVPAKYIDLMKQHILTIQKNGWGKIDQEDLNHGHLVLKPEANLREPVTALKLFKASVGVLYHTDEKTHRWRGEDGDLPVKSRRPRSFVAYWGGTVITASSFFEKVEDKTAHFSCCGTVHMDELASERPKEFAFWRGYQVVVQGSKPCYVNLIIDIYYSSLDELTLQVNGKGYAVTMSCRESRWL